MSESLDDNLQEYDQWCQERWEYALANLTKKRCQCQERSCPVCLGNCPRIARKTLWSPDLGEYAPVEFCARCGANAVASGAFTDLNPDYKQYLESNIDPRD